ncbi:MAG: methionine--tRNA ligase, partial [Bradyrhizobium sp.]
MARLAKKIARKRKTKKAGKASRVRATRAVAKKTRKAAKKTVKKAVKKATRKVAKKRVKKAAKKPATKPATKPPAEKTKAQATSPKKAKAAANSKTKASSAAPAPKAPAARAKNSFYITTAIAYPNGAPHIGHAYEAIATDALARFQRLDGKDVFFLTGTDEHGLKMIQTAEAEKLTPMEVATRNAQRFKEMDQRLNISFDRFIRTTEEQHHRSSQEIWKRMADNGDIYLDSYAGWYSVRDEAYYAEDETTLGEDDVRRGPQGTPVDWVEEKSYFFRLSAYQDRLLALYEV